jgi:predicted nuclease of predicted toxin-antitoxin system
VKLLLDQNLSHRLIHLLAVEYPGSEHVRKIGLERADDSIVWDYAKSNGFIILSKDSDFHQRSFLFGHPPKVIWIRRGNCSTKVIESIMREHLEDVSEFVDSEEAAFLALF